MIRFADMERPRCPSPERMRSLFACGALTANAKAFDVNGEGDPSPAANAKAFDVNGEGDRGADDGPTVEELRGNGCDLVAEWSRMRELPLAERVQVCRECPRSTGSYPPTTRLYAAAINHLALYEVGLAPGRDAYTEREIQGVAWVKAEISRCSRERAKSRAREH